MLPALNKWRARRALRKARRRLARKRYDAALSACDFALEMDCANARAMALVHRIQQAQIDHLQAQSEADPEDFEIRFHLARLYAAEELYPQAARQLRAAQRLAPCTQDAAQKDLLRLRGRISCGLEWHRRALDEFRRGDEPGFVQAEIQYYTGLCHLALGRRMRAFGVFEQFIAKNPWIAHHRLKELLAENADRAADPLASTPPV